MQGRWHVPGAARLEPPGSGERFGSDAAPAIVAALDGVLLDALVRGHYDPGRIRDAIVRITTPEPLIAARRADPG